MFFWKSCKILNNLLPTDKMYSLISYLPISFMLILCLILFNFNKTGCWGHNIESTSESSPNLIDTINTLKNKIKDTSGVGKVEDIPQISDWKKKCKEKVGNRQWRVIRGAPARITGCIANYIEITKLEEEIEDSKARGELDDVFRKYCGYRDQLLECVEQELNRVEPCFTDQQLADLEILQNAVNASLDFICHNNGDRIALFMAEDGVQCLNQTYEEIRDCIQSKLPEVKDAIDDPSSILLDQLVINEDMCKKISVARECIAVPTETCDDPTTNNLVDSLIIQVLKVTPCSSVDSAPPPTDGPTASASVVYLHLRAWLPHALTLILAGLTAAHILL